jgi:hypothetical protein
MKLTMILVAAVLAVTAAGAQGQEAPPDVQVPPVRIQPPPIEDLLATRAESVVAVKFVLKVQMTMMGESRDREQNSETRGVLIDEKGLILTPNSAFDGGMPAGLMRMLGEELEMKGTPVDIRVLFGNEEEEYEALLVARDSNLGIAFVQIVDLKGREVTPVNLEDGAPVRIGEDLYGVTRLGRGFDCAAAIGRLFVIARIEKPRKMWAVSGEFASDGAVVYNRFGHPVGIFSIQTASEGVTLDEEMGPFAAAEIGESLLSAVLPLSEVARTIKAAGERAAEAMEKYREAKAGKDGDEKTETPDEGDE